MAKSSTKLCGDCVWLKRKGETGQSCEMSGQSVSSPACDDFKQKPHGKISDLKDLPTIQKLVARISSEDFSVDPTLKKELVKYKLAGPLTKRRIPRKIHSENDLERVLSLFEECQAFRDRVVEILMSLRPMQKELQRAYDLAECALLDQGAYRALPNARSRQLALLRVASPIDKKLVLVDSLVSMCELVISNLDHTHFALKEIKEIGIVYLNRKNPIREKRVGP